MSRFDTFIVRIAPPHAHIRAVGELDIAISPQLDNQLSAAVAAGCSRFTLDLGDVTFCDVSTMTVIANLDRTLRDTDGSLEVVAASEQVRYVLHVFGLDRLIKATDDDPPGSGSH